MRSSFLTLLKKLSPLLLVFIITIPAFFSLTNNQYFPMHDDQHIARLFLLHQGLLQGDLYPRWVDTLGFNFGYPLFNFYPPLIYYVAEIFHLVGFSLITSIKLMLIVGFVTGAWGVYLLAKQFIGKAAGLFSTVLFTYFSYHAVNVYVRGAFAEFFAMSILPFVFLTFNNLYKNPDTRSSLIFSATLAILILTHPLIAIPTLIFIGLMLIFLLFVHPEKTTRATLSEIMKLFKHLVVGGLTAIALSAFFWLPSMLERKYTMVDSILLTELANYKLHFIYPQQFLYSPWGFGGSIVGPNDGMSFALGKIHIFAFAAAVGLSLFYYYLIKTKKLDLKNRQNGIKHTFAQKMINIKYFWLFIFLLLFSIFMSTVLSSFIWDKMHFLWYLQFPWRFLTFTSIFIALAGGYALFFVTHTYQHLNTVKILTALAVIFSLIPIIQYQKYFHPQKFIVITDRQKISFDEIAWRVSRSSFEFVPKGVKTTKSELNTTIIDIKPQELNKKLYELVDGEAKVSLNKNNFNEKKFEIVVTRTATIRFNVFNFPGWHAFKNAIPIDIDDKNDYKLITVKIEPGRWQIDLLFQNTRTQNIAEIISLVSLILVAGYLATPLFSKISSEETM